MIKVRKAEASDNESLLNIQIRSPQGTDFVLQTDSSPDFFNRTRSYENGYVFVAEENGVLVGTSSYAIMDTVLSGVECKAGYGFGLMVDPDHRRKGISTYLGKSMNGFIEAQDVDFRFAMIIEGNTPSLRQIEKRGFTHFNDFQRMTLIIHDGQPPVNPEHIRSMKESDAEELAKLLNNHYTGYDLYKPLTEKSLLKEIDRYPFFDIENILLYENDQGIQASLGYWDYDKIMRLSILKAPDAMIEAAIASNAPFIPKEGNTLSHYLSIYPALRDAKAFTDLVRYANKLLWKKKVHNLSIPVNVGTPTHTVLSGFPHIPGNMHIMAKPQKGTKFPNWGKNPVYIDPAHL